jgi:hypothetical protein
LASALTGCGGSPSTPTATPTTPAPAAPSPVPIPGPVQLAMFSDPASSFSTSDVRDVQDQIVRFDVTGNTLIWAADGRSFAGYPVNGNFLGTNENFQVRFGTKDGERRAYFTETVATTICNVEIVGGQLLITPTNVNVPES